MKDQSHQKKAPEIIVQDTQFKIDLHKESPKLSKLKSKSVNLPKLTYRCQLEAYLKDSNAYGNVYFARYFEWQGVVREKWVSEKIVPSIFDLDQILITKEAYINYKNETLPFQKIEATLNTSDFKPASFKLNIRFYDAKSKILLAEGFQTIVFASKTRKIVRVPQEILEKMKEYVQ